MNAIATYLRHVREELAHVAWPSTRTAIGHTLVVIFISAVVVAFVGTLDYGFTTIVSRIVGA